jgi:DNA recombination protein RmuC
MVRSMSEVLLIIIGVVLLGSIFLLYFLLRPKVSPGADLNALETEKRVLSERIRMMEEHLNTQSAAVKEKDQRILGLNGDLSRKDAELKALNEKYTEYRSEIDKLQEKFRTEFKNLANEILEEKTQKFTEQNSIKLNDILKPLGEKIRDFEKKVEETYNKESQQRFSLEKEIKNLAELNLKISEDAQNLTTALKSDVKKQGNWGELVLERVLESSGLVKGFEYSREFATRSGEGDIYRPDVIINLPDNKHIIIDSKVSLNAYNEFVNADNQEEREKYLKLHLLSIRNHVKLLSEKNYAGLEAFDTPDYVLLFMPIESSFSIAIQSDIDLFHYSWEKKVVIVSPTTLLATLKTVASIWKHEKQELNAQDIAKRSGDLYDKFVGFLEDLLDIGVRLDQAKRSYEQSVNKLQTGKGNLISKAEKIRELGARTSKSLPKELKDKLDSEESD